MSTVEPAVPPHLDLAFFHRLLDVDERDPAVELLSKAREVSRGLGYLVMAAAARDGVVGTGSADELRRMRLRLDFYAEVLRHCRPLGARAVKGPALAVWYPADLPRPMNDLDLVVPDEAALWRTVGAVIDAFGPRTMDVTVFGGEPRHFLVALAWPGLDPLLDHDLRVEICTCAFTGDHAAVPMRALLPEDEVAAGLLGVAEERFQRPFNAKDAADVIMALAPGRPVDPALIVESAERWRLAPELLELLLHTRAHSDHLDHLDHGLLDGLALAARREQGRREAWSRDHGATKEATGPIGTYVASALRAQSTPVFGMQLTELERGTRPRRDPAAAVVHHFDGGALLRTPAADFLLVLDALVDQDLYDRGMAALRDLDAV